MTVVSVAMVLLAGTGSVWLALTVTLFLIVSGVVGLIVMLKFRLEPGGMSAPPLQVKTLPDGVQLPVPGKAETRTASAGKVSVKTIFVAFPGHAFVTESE